jgi:NAD(P)-dependent dehydrogenase (short-subunit alcohol dehydrogenase family)
MPTSRLQNKTAIITGAGQGIGLAIARRFANEGAHIVIAEIDAALAHEAAQAIHDTGGDALALPTDVADPSSIGLMLHATLDRFGSLDILVNNAAFAGYPFADAVQDIPLESWRKLFSVNLDGVLLCSQAAARQMIAQGRGGRIVNIASIMGLLGVPRMAAYQVAKRAVMGLTTSLALELVPHGIVVNAIAPGWVDTRWNVEAVQTPQWHDKYLKTGRLPIRRQATPDEIASVALFFASDDCSYVVGQTLIVDGGLSLTLE